ncbi:hypothetical protein CFOL_v3_34111, partial [Cephalotus follicularis]
RPPTR